MSDDKNKPISNERMSKLLEFVIKYKEKQEKAKKENK
jgi:hypothetical protein